MTLVAQNGKEFDYGNYATLWIQGGLDGTWSIFVAHVPFKKDPVEHLMGTYENLEMAQLVYDDFCQAEEEKRKDFVF